MAIQLGYCTNVHAGATLDETIANLNQHAAAVRRSFRADRAMGIGLWFAAPVARALRDSRQLERLVGCLHDNQLAPFTLNGFPYGNFHQEVVKYDVYQPDWSAPRRLQYTLDLINILDQLLPPGSEGSISTLPLMWGRPAPASNRLQQAARHLTTVADHLAALESDTGRLIHLDLEPEPGCVLQRSDDVVRFFKDYLLPTGDEARLRRYLRVCHDICHTAVMFEDQTAALQRYLDAGIEIGKVQISSAVEADFRDMTADQCVLANRQLEAFVENRYLHQTSVRASDSNVVHFFDDLPAALAEMPSHGTLRGCWRVHFHVPIHLAALDRLHTTQAQIAEVLATLASHDQVWHYEVETYAWNVLPESLRQPTLADGIALEMQYAAETLAQRGLSDA